jgi:hypothetical protein
MIEIRDMYLASTIDGVKKCLILMSQVRDGMEPLIMLESKMERIFGILSSRIQ